MHANDGRVVSNFIVQALRKKEITIFGEGTQTRSFCYVDDMIGAFIELMRTRDDITGPINLGNPEELTILELANTIKELMGSNVNLKKLPLPENDPTRRCPDISLAKDILKWKPKIPLKEGLLKTINYFDSVLTNSP